MKRKKRLQKGIESIKKQVGIHEEKLEEAKEKGDEDLVRYYIKEIANLEREEDKKKEQLEKQ